MSSTYSRIFSILNYANSQTEWDQFTLASSIRQRGLTDLSFKEFKLKLNGANIDAYMQEKSIIGLIDLMIDLDLLRNNANIISMTSNGLKCINSEDNFKMQIRSSVMSLLQSKNIPLSLIIESINKILLPNVPNIETIYENLSSQAKGFINLNLLRRLLFLLACAEGVNRVWTVYYREV